MPEDPFDVIPYEDIRGDWVKLGSGSFGNVYKGTYLGIDVAIKEVLPSSEYDVAKYFEREWRLMKECRHPNICLFIGLSRAPDPDNRVFIISEFIENGNVRQYIHSKSKPFPWRLRMSFATDVARSLAYLHARRCIHRDLKGENLLITANGRLKITDFGFARIAARNEEEYKRLTFCGTDSYMSPEILLGEEFELATDVFSLGIIFCEIASRKLADDTTFKRYPPHFSIDQDEVRKLASPGCPPDFIELCLDCLATDPAMRPTTRVILERLRAIEAEVLLRPSEAEDTHLGSIRFMMGGKRPSGPRIPSFGVGVGKDIRSGAESSGTPSDESDDELKEAISVLSAVGTSSVWGKSTSGSLSQQPLLNGSTSQYSTTVIRGHHSQQGTATQAASLSSILTIRPNLDPNDTPEPVLPATPVSFSAYPSPVSSSVSGEQISTSIIVRDDPLGPDGSLFSISTADSYHTAEATTYTISSTRATEGDSIFRAVHRFTLLKPGSKPRHANNGNVSPSRDAPSASGWNPLELFFSSGILVAKCDLCAKRLGWKPVLECDDCGLRTHVKCGELAPLDCGIRQIRPGSSASTRAKQNLDGAQPKPHSPARR